MWTAAGRGRYGRDRLRYPSGLTDAEWGLIAPLIRPAKRGGPRRLVGGPGDMNGLLYVIVTSCQWCHPSQQHPPCPTMQCHLHR